MCGGGGVCIERCVQAGVHAKSAVQVCAKCAGVQRINVTYSLTPGDPEGREDEETFL